ncbi:hypothetical protein [Sphingomonas dokdonensis]|uniref:Uncharacterized protein n=1 Tax=Sphingomonas dokdonensis TaxID=344880 RepID=A0A245ZTR8_9SPHN|nr:hypothetical protein [Sphingomonas dokdonensis]OWK33142.1 hypothetical protein SPDO_00160 [Sphingomonas dokdonensis]
MAYLAFDENGAVQQSAMTDRATDARLSALEWAVVVLARRDTLATLREPGRLSMALGNLFGRTPNPRLADPKLEALRRLAVLSWHDLVAVPAQEIAAFLAAGFTNAHYQTLRASIRAATINKAQRA